MDQLDQMMAWEEGALNDDETDVLFQSLVDSSLAWRLQGTYGREAQRLIAEGRIHARP